MSAPSPSAAPGTRRNDFAVAAGIALVSAIVHSWLILRLPQQVGQFSKYPNAAIQQLHGMAQPERLLDFSPLYLGLHLAAFRYLLQPLTALAWVQIALISLTAALLFLILRRRFGTTLALAGAAAFVLGKSVVIYAHVFEPEPLAIFLLTALVYFASLESRTGAALAGVSLALCVLTRPSFLPLAAAVPVSLWLGSRDRSRLPAALALFFIPVLMAVAFMATRNQQLTGETSLVGMNPGTVFFDGNSPLAGGGGAAYPPLIGDLSAAYPGESDYQHAVYRLVARTVTARNLTPEEANRFWAGKALRYIRDFPGAFAALTARRTLYLFHGYRWDDLRVSWAAGRALDEAKFPFVPFALVSALAVLGLAAAAGSWRTHLLAYAVFANQAVFMVLVYATDRQRVSLYPFFVYFAIAAVSRLRAVGRPARVAGLAVVALLFFAFSVDSDRMVDNRHIWEGFARQRHLATEGGLDPASPGRPDLPLLRPAMLLALAPWSLDSARPAGVPAAPGELAGIAAQELLSLRPVTPSSRLDRALLLIEAGRLDEAGALLNGLESEGRAFARLNGRLPYPAYHLGRIAALRGRPDDAVRLTRRALEAAPGDPAVLAQLACLTDDPSPAGSVFRYLDDLDALLLLGRACLENGRPAAAAGYLERLSGLLPEYRKGQILLAAALGDAGRDAGAADIYAMASEQDLETVLLEERIVPVFERLARDGTPEALYRYGVVLRQYGRRSEARQVLAHAAAAGSQAAAAELDAPEDAPGATP